MVTSPMDALWDCGQYWQALGGKWGPADAVHFEYPGFSPQLGPQDGTGTTIEKAKDILVGFAGPVGELLSGADLAESLGIPVGNAVHLLTHPSEAVRTYPWLRALGPPFIFY
jgi:hypothetical protein